MIVKRNRPPKLSNVRRIVRRNRPEVGTVIGRTIVKRHAGGVVGGGVVGGPPRGPRGPRFHRPHFSWRPSRALIWTCTTVTVLVMVGYGCYWTWTSPFFKVSNIEVSGNQRVATGTLVEATGLLGESMFDADLAAAQRSLYAQPLVNSVTIERQWPHTIKIAVVERKPWGTWEQSGVKYTIDREGVVLGIGTAPEGSPVIKSSEPGNRIAGDHVDYQAVDAAAEIYEKLPRQLGTTVSEVAFITGKGVQVTTANNQTALFGDSSSIAYKLAVWAALQSEAQAQRINYSTIDLRYGNRPVLQ
ncbi:MAG: cell division protein FtsQ/DivIB [Dehalococcoidia bacterium]